MSLLQNDFTNLQRKVNQYKEILENTIKYRKVWKTELKAFIINQLQDIITTTGLTATIEERNELGNLEAITLTLGVVESGLAEPVSKTMQRQLIKNNGSLVYQQLFNGKILVAINLPFIEKYGQPQQPKTIAIYRPEEIKEPYILRHVETFIHDVTLWEDYDDDVIDANQRIGFKMNFDPPKDGK
jgi:hypothetical protein